MKKLLVLIIIFAGFQSVSAQSFIPNFIRKMYFSKDTGKHAGFVIVPVLTSAPETGLEVGGTALLSFYSDSVKSNTRVSNVYGYATLTTKGQSHLSLSTSYWTPGNKDHYTVGLRFNNYPFLFYGVGNDTRKADADHVTEKRYKFNFADEKLLGTDFYVGYVAGAFNYTFDDNNRAGVFYNDPLVENRRGGASVYIGPSFVYDTRNNNTYTTKGIIVTSYFNMMHGIYENKSYEGGFFNIEYSQFFALNKQLVLGLDVQEQSLTGYRSPFYLMPQMGSDEMMRGYYGGRYRDRNYIAGQTELRYRLSQRVGFVAFVGTGEVFHTNFTFPELKPNYGGGFRYFFDVEKGLAIRFDYGIGQKPAGEPREGGFYIGLGQSF